MALRCVSGAFRFVQVPLTMQFHALRIADLVRETADCVSLAFDIPAALQAAFAFRPGQYLTLRTHRDGEELRRAYSICAGLDDGEIRVAIKRADPGGFSEWANTALRAGDVIDVMPPDGGFGLAPEPTARRTVLGVAAGSGITPILSIIKSVLAREPESQVILLYGSRSTADIIFRAALEDLKDRYIDRFTLIHVLSREAQDIGVLNGRIDADKLAALLPGLASAGDIDAAFLCGPAEMLDVLPGALLAWGVPEARIHTERFTPSGPRRAAVVVAADAPAFAIATIIHDGQTKIVPVAAGEAVLDAALRAGMDLPWSCRGGMCSTCRARVVLGAVEMAENFSLEKWETDAGYVLSCQAHPVSREITLDYDHV